MTDDQRRSFLMWLAGDRPELPAWLELWQASLQRLADRTGEDRSPEGGAA
jgi:hypothetical protein